MNNEIKWTKVNNLVPINIIYEVFGNAIKANVDSKFMCGFIKDEIIYIASPNTLNLYPKEFLDSIENGHVWAIKSD